jgi:hypothetical protein
MRWVPIFALFFASVFAHEPAQADLFSCSEQGILDAIAQGGGPHTFDCAEPTTVITTDAVFIEKDVILDGEGNLTVSGGDDHPVFRISVNITVELHNLNITHGAADFDVPCCDGGGIKNLGDLTLVNCEVTENFAINGGGGIKNSGRYPVARKARLVVIDSTVSNNSAVSGGGISSGGPGAILVVEGSTVSGNEITSWGRGGGISSNSDLVIINSSVSSNSAPHDWSGGGISHMGGRLSLTNATLSGNSPSELFLTDPAFVANTIFDGPCAGNFFLVVSLGGNLEGPDDTCGLTHASDQVRVPDLFLGALADNGGPTWTHALLPGSPAIDASSGDCPPPATDQRGVLRPQGAGCDIGSVESLSEKVTMCHNGKRSISVSANAVPAHLAHGDTLGACP